MITHVRIVGPALQVPPVYGENIIISNCQVVLSEICTKTFLFYFPCKKDIQFSCILDRSFLFLKDQSFIYFYLVKSKCLKQTSEDKILHDYSS